MIATAAAQAALDVGFDAFVRVPSGCEHTATRANPYLGNCRAILVTWASSNPRRRRKRYPLSHIFSGHRKNNSDTIRNT
jgi:hypothetical protein